MEPWLQNIIEILSTPEFPQIRGALEKEEDGVIGKCALGEIRCRVGAKEDDICDSGGVIMRTAGVPFEFCRYGILPDVISVYDKENNIIVLKGFHDENDELYTANIQTWIYKLNDCGFSYPQICDFLEVTFGDV